MEVSAINSIFRSNGICIKVKCRERRISRSLEFLYDQIFLYTHKYIYVFVYHILFTVRFYYILEVRTYVRFCTVHSTINNNKAKITVRTRSTKDYTALSEIRNTCVPSDPMKSSSQIISSSHVMVCRTVNNKINGRYIQRT